MEHTTFIHCAGAKTQPTPTIIPHRFLPSPSVAYPGYVIICYLIGPLDVIQSWQPEDPTAHLRTLYPQPIRHRPCLSSNLFIRIYKLNFDNPLQSSPYNAITPVGKCGKFYNTWIFPAIMAFQLLFHMCYGYDNQE
jgi:hypothetical protein